MLIPFIMLAIMGAVPQNPGSVPHALYLSVVQIDHQGPGTDTQVLIKVFSNDLEDVIRAAYPKQYLAAQPATFCTANKVAIGQYFQSKLRFDVNGTDRELSFLRGEWENEVYWLHFKLRVPEAWRSLSVRASHFMEIFSTQSNVIQVKYLAERRFARLTRESDTVEFEF